MPWPRYGSSRLGQTDQRARQEAISPSTLRMLSTSRSHHRSRRQYDVIDTSRAATVGRPRCYTHREALSRFEPVLAQCSAGGSSLRRASRRKSTAAPRPARASSSRRAKRAQQREQGPGRARRPCRADGFQSWPPFVSRCRPCEPQGVGKQAGLQRLTPRSASGLGRGANRIASVTIGVRGRSGANGTTSAATKPKFARYAPDSDPSARRSTVQGALLCHREEIGNRADTLWNHQERRRSLKALLDRRLCGVPASRREGNAKDRPRNGVPSDNGQLRDSIAGLLGLNDDYLRFLHRQHDRRTIVGSSERHSEADWRGVQ